jgi:hypothetical protein
MLHFLICFMPFIMDASSARVFIVTVFYVCFWFHVFWFVLGSFQNQFLSTSNWPRSWTSFYFNFLTQDSYFMQVWIWILYSLMIKPRVWISNRKFLLSALITFSNHCPLLLSWLGGTDFLVYLLWTWGLLSSPWLQVWGLNTCTHLTWS